MEKRTLPRNIEDRFMILSMSKEVFIPVAVFTIFSFVFSIAMYIIFKLNFIVIFVVPGIVFFILNVLFSEVRKYESMFNYFCRRFIHFKNVDETFYRDRRADYEKFAKFNNTKKEK